MSMVIGRYVYQYGYRQGIRRDADALDALKCSGSRCMRRSIVFIPFLTVDPPLMKIGCVRVRASASG